MTSPALGIILLLLATGVTETMQKESDLGPLVSQILSVYLKGCQILLVSQGKDGPVFNSLLRSLKEAYIPKVILELSDATIEHGQNLWMRLKRGEDKFNCTVLIFDLTTTGSDASLALRLMEAMQLFLIRNAAVLFLGSKSYIESTLGDSVLRNTASVLYLATTPGRVLLYSRCLYCNAGEIGIELADVWTPETGYMKSNDLIKGQFRDFMGHRFNIVTLSWFPIIDFERDSDEEATTVTPQDSLAVRILISVAESLNFTYEMRVPWDNNWGIQKENGNWTGNIGTIQHENADFSMLTAWTMSRFQVVDYTRIYSSEPIVLISSKPRPLSPSLAIVRPLPGSLWLAIFLSSVFAGFFFWLVQRGWTAIADKRMLSLGDSVLFTWSILLEEPPKAIPTNASGQMFVGWWWVYCTLISVIYKSLLIAHLSVPGMSQPMDSFEQLVQANGWTWGYEPVYGTGWEWLKFNENPAVKEIFQKLEVQEITKQMDRLLRGPHALITFKYRINSLIASSYTDRFGYTPVYTAKSEYSMTLGYGWAIRKNAPFLNSIDLKKQQLIETGFTTLWLKQLIDVAGKEARDKQRADPSGGGSASLTLEEETSRKVILSLHHLQGVFFVLFLGCLGSFLSLIMEKLIYNYARKNGKIDLQLR